VVSISRHGSRYPDRGAYNGWVNLASRIHAGQLDIRDKSLQFLSTWQPVLDHSDQQIAQESPGGYKELYDMGGTYRQRYAELYEYNTPFTMWANYYSGSPRVRDSARLFARGFLGPNATDLGSIYALNSSDLRSWQNSLGPSDLCLAYNDNGGGDQKSAWDNKYQPPIQRRLNKMLKGSFQFTQSDVDTIPYLCGFESQITGSRSPWCDVFTEDEILQYEYSQDLRYWYGTGLGTDIEKYLMLPVLQGVVNRFVDGPNATYKNFVPPKVNVGFTNDGQTSQLVAALGIFDNEKNLPSDKMPKNRLFVSSRLMSMRGTILFERLTCSARGSGSDSYVRIRLNDAVYPVVDCKGGPGKSCPLDQYQKLVQKKLKSARDFAKICNITDPAIPRGVNTATFFTDVTLPWEVLIKP
jgi:acid phosphatase